MFVTNTESDLFYKADESELPPRRGTVVSGRFAGRALGGGEHLGSPTTSRIPEDSEAGEVLASVPGTTAANEAVILASIPNKAVVNKSEVTLKVEYTGQPDFRPIEGTVVHLHVTTRRTAFFS